MRRTRRKFPETCRSLLQGQQRQQRPQAEGTRWELLNTNLRIRK